MGFPVLGSKESLSDGTRRTGKELPPTLLASCHSRLRER